MLFLVLFSRNIFIHLYILVIDFFIYVFCSLYVTFLLHPERLKGPLGENITPTVLSQEVEFNQWWGGHLHAFMTQSLLGIRQIFLGLHCREDRNICRVV